LAHRSPGNSSTGWVSFSDSPNRVTRPWYSYKLHV